MKLRSMSALAVVALATSLAGFAATGCQNFDVGTSIQPQDSTPTPGLDDPGSNPSGNVVPLEQSGFELESPDR